MNSQDFEMYPCNLMEFVAKFVAHNNIVYLYSKEICDEYVTDGRPSNMRPTHSKLLRPGSARETADNEYIASKDDLLRCPFWDAKVVGVCPVMKEDRLFDDSVDEIGIVVEEKANILT